MKKQQVFEQFEPPPHGLTRLKSRMAERKASRIVRPVLALGVVATVLAVVFWPRAPEKGVDFSASVSAMNAMDGDVMARGDTSIELMKSTNPRVVLVRAMVANEKAEVFSPSP